MSLPPAIPIFLAGLTMLLFAGQMAHARPSFPVFSIASDRPGLTTVAPRSASGRELSRQNKSRAWGSPVTGGLNAIQSVIMAAVVAKVRSWSVSSAHALRR